MCTPREEIKLVTCKNAYYVKLGRKGAWEKASIKKGLIRIGWRQQALSDINNGRWGIIQRQLEKEMADQGVATRDCRALRMLCESTVDDIWITFHGNRLWWCKVAESKIYEDKTSKYRKVQGWHSEDVLGKPLLTTQIPGSLSKIQGFRGTICKVKEVEDLRRLVNRQHSSEYTAILYSKENLCRHIEDGIRKLHWKDFEMLVDLLFRETGWRRVSGVGETMKFSDLDLEEPITGDMYQVQIKSRATLREFQEYADNFTGGKYRKLFFVVHSPDQKLAKHNQTEANQVEVLGPSKIAEMVVNLGMVTWLTNKI